MESDTSLKSIGERDFAKNMCLLGVIPYSQG